MFHSITMHNNTIQLHSFLKIIVPIIQTIHIQSQCISFVCTRTIHISIRPPWWTQYNTYNVNDSNSKIYTLILCINKIIYLLLRIVSNLRCGLYEFRKKYFIYGACLDLLYQTNPSTNSISLSTSLLTLKRKVI